MRLLNRVLWGLITAAVAVVSLRAEPNVEAQKGNGGWLIYSGGTLPDYLHTSTLSEPQLKDLRNKLAKIESDLRQRGTTFFWIVPPDTPTIYPESMPARYKPVGPTSKLQQMNAALTGSGLSSFVDLSATLADAKKANTRPIYRKTDTHWNDLGAFAAYREIMRRMAESRPDLKTHLTPMSIDAYVLTTQKGYSGDLAGMMGLSGDLTEDLPVLTAKSERSAAIAASTVRAIQGVRQPVQIPVPNVSIEIKRPGVVAINNAARCPGPSLVMYHDSYGIHLAQWMVEHFCDSTYYFPADHPATASFDAEMLAKTKPTFVVLESVERFATHPINAAILDALFSMERPVAKAMQK
jgi:hypothetical protein